MAAWKLTARGKLFHSGFPNRAINAIELVMDAVQEVQRRFYKDFQLSLALLFASLPAA